MRYLLCSGTLNLITSTVQSIRNDVYERVVHASLGQNLKEFQNTTDTQGTFKDTQTKCSVKTKQYKTRLVQAINIWYYFSFYYSLNYYLHIHSFLEFTWEMLGLLRTFTMLFWFSFQITHSLFQISTFIVYFILFLCMSFLIEITLTNIKNNNINNSSSSSIDNYNSNTILCNYRNKTNTLLKINVY